MTTTYVRMDVSPDDADLIKKILSRMELENCDEHNDVAVKMVACHLNASGPLLLKSLAAAPYHELTDDVRLVQQFLDRSTGKLPLGIAPKHSRVRQLQEMWNVAGLTYGEIAEALDLPSRNAAAGLINRARLRGFHFKERSSSPQPKPRPQKLTKILFFKPRPVAPLPVLHSEPDEPAVPLMDHDDWQCKAVLGPNAYCSKQRLSGRPYCRIHDVGMTQKVKKTTRTEYRIR